MMQMGGRGVFRARSINFIPSSLPRRDQQRSIFAVEHIHRSGDVRCDMYVILILEQTPQSVAGVFLIVNNQDGGLMESIGNGRV
jgi:hypothetical protein